MGVMGVMGVPGSPSAPIFGLPGTYPVSPGSVTCRLPLFAAGDAGAAALTKAGAANGAGAEATKCGAPCRTWCACASGRGAGKLPGNVIASWRRTGGARRGMAVAFWNFSSWSSAMTYLGPDIVCRCVDATSAAAALSPAARSSAGRQGQAASLPGSFAGICKSRKTFSGFSRSKPHRLFRSQLELPVPAASSGRRMRCSAARPKPQKQ